MRQSTAPERRVDNRQSRAVELHASALLNWTIMRLRVVRCLVLACSLNLVLPAGWCCIFEPVASQQKENADAPQCPTCCGHCKSACRAESPNHTETPAPAPKPTAPVECPCTWRYTTAPKTVTPINCDLCLSITEIVFDIKPSVVGPIGPSDAAFSLSSPSLQTLHCNWLC